MNFKKLEAIREELLSLLVRGYSPRYKLFSINNFIKELHGFDNKNIIESYLAEFFDEYLALLKIYEPSGLEPQKTKEIISGIRIVLSLGVFTEHAALLNSMEKSLHDKCDELESVLSGLNRGGGGRFYFPIIEHDSGRNSSDGFLDSVEVRISKNSKIREDKFFIIPSTEKVEKRLDDQIRNSWEAALKFVKQKSVRTSGAHDVVISFDKKYGEYVGNSLGLMLTFAFISELFNLYQTRDVIKINTGVALTGGTDINGQVPVIPDNIIADKAGIVFFSSVKYFVVPKGCEKAARSKIDKLLEEYPDRDLKIFGVDSINDLLDRRSLVNIHRINPALVIGKKLYKRKYTSAVMLVLFLSTGYFFAKNYDRNPYSLDLSEHLLKVKNKYGHILWQTKLGYDDRIAVQKYMVDQTARIVDINDDGQNEVILANEQYDVLKSSKEWGRVSCFDYEHKLIWKYVFRDSIRTNGEKFSPYYSLKIFGINKDLPEPEILLVGQHENFYPSPLIKLRLKDGKRIGHIFWHPGGGSQGFIGDIDSDGKEEVVADAISNGLESCVLYSIEYDKLEGTAPTTSNYRFVNMPVADFDHYLILPKSDLNRYYKERYTFLEGPPFFTYDSLLYVGLMEAELNTMFNPGITYEFTKNFDLKAIVIGDKFRVLRDSLVAEGKIKGPYTETPEYHKYLRDQIKYWDGKKFVRMYNPKQKSKGD